MFHIVPLGGGGARRQCPPRPPRRPPGAATKGGGRVPRTHKAVCPEPGHRAAFVLPPCSESAADTHKPRGDDEHNEGNLCWSRLSGQFSITAATDGSMPFGFNAIALRAMVFFFAKVRFGFGLRFAPSSETFPVVVGSSAATMEGWMKAAAAVIEVEATNRGTECATERKSNGRGNSCRSRIGDTREHVAPANEDAPTRPTSKIGN